MQGGVQALRGDGQLLLHLLGTHAGREQLARPSLAHPERLVLIVEA